MTSIVNAWPKDFMRRMSGWLGNEAPNFFYALTKHDIGLRLNLLRGPLEALRARIPWKVEPVPWCSEGLWPQEEEVQAGAHPYNVAGVYYIQNPSAMAAAMFLDPQPGEWVLSRLQ